MKSEIMTMLFRDFFDTSSDKRDPEKQKITMLTALMLKDEIEMMGFPVDYTITYFYPYQLGHRSRVCVGVTVHRPPKDGTPEEQADYDRWYKGKMGLSDDQFNPPSPEPEK
ncbi:MAG: hypothetical protein AAB345_00550 [Patescibacteria group bacterium]